MPWIQINGFPAVFLDVAARRFHLFGWTFVAQDMWLLFFLISGLGFTLFFVTALFGRIWCGWACPQTVFLDHVYRRIERWIEGDAVKRRALEAAPISAEKIFKRGVKHALYIIVSLTITHLFLAYFVSLKELWAMMHDAPLEHWSAFAFVVVFAGALYFNFAWFREQLCIVICPYGRLQSAMIDDDSMVIGYDSKRGEPRGKLNSADTGDCVDCNRCVQVCPTGIDIRQGLQMECIGCTACIDACDDVMTRIHKPKGLIRYDSQNHFAGKVTHLLRPRTILYTILLLVGMSVSTWAITSLKPANVGITRIIGAPYFVDHDVVRNQFLVRLINKGSIPTDLIISVAAPVPVEQSGLVEALTIDPMHEEVRPLVLRVPRATYEGPFTFTLKVTDRAKSFTITREVEFLGPDAYLLREHKEASKP